MLTVLAEIHENQVCGYNALTSVLLKAPNYLVLVVEACKSRMAAA